MQSDNSTHHIEEGEEKAKEEKRIDKQQLKRPKQSKQSKQSEQSKLIDRLSLSDNIIDPPAWLELQDRNISAAESQKYTEWQEKHGCDVFVRKAAWRYLNQNFPILGGDVTEVIPTWEGLARFLESECKIKYTAATLSNWAVKNLNDFSRVSEKKKDIQNLVLINLGLSGKLEKNLVRLMLARNGIRDDQSTGVILQVIDHF